MFDDVTGHFQEASLVLQRYESFLRTVIHGDLERLDERSQAFDIPLYAEIAEDEHGCHRRSFLKRGECRDEEAQPDLSLDAVVHEINYFDVEIGNIQFVSD